MLCNPKPTSGLQAIFPTMKCFSFLCLAVSLCFVHSAVLPETASAAAQLTQVSHASEQFSGKLLHSLEQTAGDGQNVFISGFSVSTALAMLLTGAANQTAAEIRQSLGLSDASFSQTDLLAGYKQLLHELNHPALQTPNQLSLANALAVQKNKALLESFLNAVVDNFGAQVMVKDFASQGSEAASELNAWVNQKTHGKIPKLLDTLEPSTVLVLLNAIYFKGTWERTFSKKATRDEAFSLSRTASKPVSMMSTSGAFKYAPFADGQLIEIPYVNKTLSMYVFLPAEPHSATPLSASLSSQSLSDRISKLYTTQVSLRLPKFKFEASYSLGPVLKRLGMGRSFSPSIADFSAIDGERDLSVSEVIHKTFIEVNEEGAEAAAATAVIIHRTASVHPPEMIRFTVDRPFMFFIHDNVHQLTLFSGVIKNPVA